MRGCVGTWVCGYVGAWVGVGVCVRGARCAVRGALCAVRGARCAVGGGRGRGRVRVRVRACACVCCRALVLVLLVWCGVVCGVWGVWCVVCGVWCGVENCGVARYVVIRRDVVWCGRICMCFVCGHVLPFVVLGILCGVLLRCDLGNGGSRGVGDIACA